MAFDPKINDMTAHLALLYDWTQTAYPNALFEVRCIHPNGGTSPNERFACTADGYERATYYALKHNDQGYNVYTTVNPLRPGTAHTATDGDVEIALYHSVDADGVNDPDRLIAERGQGFVPTFIVHTGTVPLPRCQIHWRMSEPITDMASWSSTQAALAQEFGTDQTIKNPSRVLRLAGTVSYPPPHKQERGYVTELTALTNGGSDVCRDSFAASFPYTAPACEIPPIMARDSLRDACGNVPIKVIQAAFDAIPALMGKGNRDKWLDISMCACDANPKCFPEFDTWQRQSDRYDPKEDSKGWPTKAAPRQGSYLGLFKFAKSADERWWAHDPDVYEWWREQQTKRAALEHPTFGDDEEPNGQPIIEMPKQPEQKRDKKRFPIMFEAELMAQPQLKYLIADWITEDSVVTIWGKSQALKSFLLLELSLCMTHGMAWHGKRTAQGAVAYIAAEGARSIGKRVRGWKLHNKIDHTTSPFVTIPTKVNILILDEVEALIQQLQEVESEHGIKFMIVNIDTLAKCMVGGDENHARDMGIAVSHCDLIRERMGCSVIVVHHCGKNLDRGMRGSYALEGGITTSIYMERNREENIITVEMQKQKDDDDDLILRLKPVKLPLPLRPGDDWRKPDSTLVLEDYVMDCPKAVPLPTTGATIDPIHADLMSIAVLLADNIRHSVTRVAKAVFGHDRHAQRVKIAVPLDWIEVTTQFGVRHLKRTLEGERQYVETRHAAKG